MTGNTSRRETGRTRPIGYISVNVKAKTQVLLDQIQEVLNEYADYLPMTARQVFYRLVATFGYEKTEKAYKRLAQTLADARRARVVPFEAIRDDGVVIYSPTWHEGVEDFWNDAGRRIHQYRRDRQVGQRQRLELWCEAAGMAPQLTRVASEYSVPVYSAGGFLSLSAVRTIVDRATCQNGATVLLHVGDHDPSGVSIFERMVADTSAFLEVDRAIGTQRIIGDRVALTGDQVQTFGLATTPPKSTDSRSAAWDGGTCQLEALAPDELAAIVRAGIEKWLNLDALERQLELEAEDRYELQRQLPRGGA